MPRRPSSAAPIIAGTEPVNLLDRAIALVAPRAALSRAQARVALRALDAAGRKDRLRSWRASAGSANAIIGRDLARARANARDLVRNTPHGARIVDVLVAHVVGTGITYAWDTGSERMNRRLAAAWAEFVERADVTRRLDFYGLQALAVRAMVESGESITRLIDVRRERDGDVPVRLQVLEGDQIDESRDGLVLDRRTRLGVALDEWGGATGYYLHRDHPGESGSLASARDPLFVPAGDLVHLYRVLRPGQVRGLPWMAPAVVPARDLADLQEAVVVKSKIEACFSAFVVNPLDAAGGMLTPADGTGRPEIDEIAPGMVAHLPPGADIRFAQPSTTTAFAEVAMQTLMAMAAGAGVTYDQLTGDLRQANYSSLRAGKIEFRRLVEQIQWHVVIPAFCEPVRRRFLQRASIAGIVSGDLSRYRGEWVPPANEPIDPLKDLNADILAVRSGRMTPQQFFAGWGQDWRQALAQHSEFWAQADAAGLVLDIDPRRVSQTGTAQPDASADTAGDDDTDDE